MPKTVLVSGASSGLGFAAAKYLAAHGYDVYAAARSFGQGALPPEGCHALTMDVTDENSVRAAVARVCEEAGGLYALVNCAAFFTMGSCEEVPPEELHRILNTNFLGTVRVTQAVLPILRAQGGGRIINFASINGLLAIPFQGAYTASKHAIEGWSEALQQEVARFGVRVTVLEPGDCRGGSQKYRLTAEASENTNSPYHDRYIAATDKIRHDEAGGMEGAVIGKAVCRLLDRKNPPGHKIVATLTQRFSVILKKFLPRNLFNSIISDYYAPKGR